MADRQTDNGRLWPRLWLTLLWALALLFPAHGEASPTVHTLWPLFDYRTSPAEEYANLNLAGPLVKYESRQDGRRYGLRPLYFHEDFGSIESSDFLYPLATWERIGEVSSFQFLHLITSDHEADENGKKNEFMLFPFIFSSQPEQGEGYFALFPLGGKILNKYGRDRIEFALFPLYSKTTRKGTENTNILWPIFTLTRGEKESGWALWPLYGSAAKEGVYRKNFFLWPFFFRADERLDTLDPRQTRAFFPFFIWADSPTRTDHTYLWPFFSHVEDSRQDYEEWNFPWPLLRIASGSDRDVQRFLPLYADERIKANRTRWFLWPLYKIEETDGESFQRRRDRILYFLYSDLTESHLGDEELQLRRIALWPLFTYQRKDGVSQLHALSLLEPFFPENEHIERSWSPFWRLYQRRWDGHGNDASSLLWNLYWRERRGDDLAFEVFPLVFYRRESHGEDREVSILKGLYRYERNPEKTCNYFFYLPWGLCHATPVACQAPAATQE